MRRTGNMKAKASTAKPWLKFYTEEALNAKLPEETLYEHVLKNNEYHRGNIAINYFGNKISYGELLDTADVCAASFAEPATWLPAARQRYPSLHLLCTA